jgi:hypothetical protein
MKRLAFTLIAGAFGALLAYPIAYAHDYEDMNRDARAIDEQQRDIRHDKREMREDLEHGNYGAAAREKADIERDRARRDAMREDLNRDLDNAYRHGDDD